MGSREGRKRKKGESKRRGKSRENGNRRLTRRETAADAEGIVRHVRLGVCGCGMRE
jgi:hypothetical protein